MFTASHNPPEYMGLKFIRGLSADMDDLLTEKGRKEAEDFFEFVCFSVEKDCYEAFPVPMPPAAHISITPLKAGTEEKKGDVVIITDCETEDAQLNNMIARFQAVLPIKTRVVNIRKIYY